MAELKQYFFRSEIIQKSTVLNTTNCVAVGFLNIGVNASFVNRVIPIPAFNGAVGNNYLFFPVFEGERDATRYEVSFAIGGGIQRNALLVIYKEPYNVK